MLHRIIFPDNTEATVIDKRFFSHAVILQKVTGQWFVWSTHKNIDLANKKAYQCKNTFSLRGSKDVDWFSARVVIIR